VTLPVTENNGKLEGWCTTQSTWGVFYSRASRSRGISVALPRC
jgi:hypothetical protein